MSYSLKQRDSCGLCQGKDLVLVIDLGEMPLANAFHDNTVELSSYPLQVYFCRSCSSVQLLDIVDPEIVFRQYEYLTSASKPLSDHFVAMGKELADKFIESKNNLVIEIGGNDGVLLEAIKDRCRVLNIDPAVNAGILATKKGVPTINAFFSESDVDMITNCMGRAKIVVANNVMAHIENFRDVVKSVKRLLTDDGVFVFEVHWVGNMLTTGGFDQIYHEHLFYHSLTALRNVIDDKYWDIFDVELVPIHGESMRVYVGRYPQKESVRRLIDIETEMGLDNENTYIRFFDDIVNTKTQLKDNLRPYKKVVGYGAPAKGNTLINYYDIDLSYIVDTTPGKQGLYTPGKNIPVYPPSRLTEDPPDAVLVLAWNYADAILRKEKELIKSGVKFFVPIRDSGRLLMFPGKG